MQPPEILQALHSAAIVQHPAIAFINVGNILIQLTVFFPKHFPIVALKKRLLSKPHLPCRLTLQRQAEPGRLASKPFSLSRLAYIDSGFQQKAGSAVSLSKY